LSILLTPLKTLPERNLIVFKTLILFLGFFLLGSIKASAQSYPKVSQPYLLVEENHTSMVEVSAMIAQTDSIGTDSVYVMVFNEKPKKETVSFDFKVVNAGNTDSTTKSFTINMEIGEMAIPACGNGSYRNLVFALPNGYDPKKSTFSVKFK